VINVKLITANRTNTIIAPTIPNVIGLFSAYLLSIIDLLYLYESDEKSTAKTMLTAFA